MQPNEVHLTLANNGHIMSTDCWCEPANIYWYTNDRNITMLVVEHNDDQLQHRLVIVNNREAIQDWVTRVTSLKEIK